MAIDITTVDFDPNELKIKESTADEGVTNKKYVDDKVSAVTKSSLGLGNVDNTSDTNKPVSGPQATQIGLKANKAGDTFTGAVTFSAAVNGLTSTTVGLGNVDNTSDANKPVSTAQQTALNLKINKTDSKVLIYNIARKILNADTKKTPTGNATTLPELDLEVDVVSGDLIEMQLTLGCQYSSPNDVGDDVKVSYSIDGRSAVTGIPTGNLSGANANNEYGHCNLYIPFTGVASTGKLTSSLAITTRTNAERTFKANECGIVIKIYRAPT